MTRSQAQESARKVCSPNRELAQLMSRMTVNGRIPPWPEVLAAHKFHNGATAPKVS